MKYHLLLIFFSLLRVSLSQDIVAHAHNDYLNDRPLFSALNSGFHSIEVDIYEHKGTIKVSHLKIDLGGKPSFSELYLEPLVSRLESGEDMQLWLLVDLKQDNISLIDLLHEQVAANGQWFKSRNSQESRPIQIILSGSVPRRYIKESDRYEYFYLDGRIRHLEKEEWDSDLMPLISANLKKVVGWNGKGKMEERDEARVNELVQLANAQGKSLRFWKTKDMEATWTKLQQLGVDVIGTDDIAGLAAFLDLPRQPLK